MIEPTCALLIPNDFAKRGSVGAIIPKPIATKKEAKTRTPTSRGKSRRGFFSLTAFKINRAPLQQPLHEQLRNHEMYEAVSRARRELQRIQAR